MVFQRHLQHAHAAIGALGLLLDVVSGYALDAVAAGQLHFQREHSGAFDGVIHLGRQQDLFGADAEIILHHGLDLRLERLGTHAQRKFCVGKPEHAR